MKKIEYIPRSSIVGHNDALWPETEFIASCIKLKGKELFCIDYESAKNFKYIITYENIYSCLNNEKNK